MDLVQKPEKRPKLALDFEIFQIFCLHQEDPAKIHIFKSKAPKLSEKLHFYQVLLIKI